MGVKKKVSSLGLDRESSRKLRPFRSSDDVVTEINVRVLNQSVEIGISGGDSGFSSLEKDLVSLSQKNKESAREISLPDYLKKIINYPYSSGVKEAYKDKLVLGLLTDSRFSNEIRDLMLEWEDLENKQLEEGLPVSRLSEKEFRKRQLLTGARVHHTATPSNAHAVYDGPPDSFNKERFSFVPLLAKQWLKTLFDNRKINARDFSSISSPRLTSQGILLKGTREDTTIRFLRKAIQAKAAMKAESFEDINKLFLDVDNLAESYGFNFSSKTIITGIRRQQSSKYEPIMTTDNPHDIMITTGFSRHVQGRVRGIFIPPEISKIFKKPIADGLKRAMFSKHPVFSTDPDHVASSLIAITQKSDALENAFVDGTVMAYDLDNYDTTQHKGLSQLYFSFLREIVTDYDDYSSEDFIPSHRIYSSGGTSISSPVIDVFSGGNSRLSGEPEVTVANNIIAYIVFLESWAHILKLNPLDLDMMLFKEEGGFIVKLHGDDACCYMSDNLDDYGLFQQRYEESGLRLSFEPSVSYLKKVAPSAYGLKGNVLFGIPGSILKNRFGEYPRTNEAVIVAGLMDTISLIPNGSKYSKLYSAFAESVLVKTTSFTSIESARKYFRSSQFIDDITLYAAASISNANEVKNILDRHFFSNGEMFLDDNLSTIYGDVSYSTEDINALTIPDTFDDLSDLILEEQLTLFKSRGTDSILRKFSS